MAYVGGYVQLLIICMFTERESRVTSLPVLPKMLAEYRVEVIVSLSLIHIYTNKPWNIFHMQDSRIILFTLPFIVVYLSINLHLISTYS